MRNAISTHFRKQSRRPVTASETLFLEKIESQPDEREQLDWERDYQRQLLAWAMEQIKGDFAEHVWQAFEQTALRGRDPSDVAAELDMSNNAIAVAKLDEGPKMMCNIVECEQTPEALVLDMPLEVSFEKVNDEITLPHFKPAGGN